MPSSSGGLLSAAADHREPEGTEPRDYSDVSYWLEASGDWLQPRARLRTPSTVDVAILGGGFSGLWCAYYLLQQDPRLRVAVVEREICGFGASGRNGGWCTPRLPLDAGELTRRFGVTMARATLLALEDCVPVIGRVCEVEGIDAHYRATGLLSVARTPQEVKNLEATYRSYVRLGLASELRLLNPRETFDRVHATKLYGGLYSAGCATVHPGRLVRGLARAVEALGCQIFEQTEVAAVRKGTTIGLDTPGGFLEARRAVVIAGEAFVTELPGMRRDLLPVASSIGLTEPLTPAQWDEIGWSGYECLSSQARTTNYLTRTQDDRILYGSRGGRYAFGSRMPEAALRNEAVFAWMRDCLRDWWPVLNEVRFAHAWGGYVGIPRDGMPQVSFDRESRLGRLNGYGGRGVTASALAARLLAGLITGTQTGLEALPFHRASMPRWEPEPARWLGARYVQNAYLRIDEAEQAGRARPWDAWIAERVGNL